MEQFLPFLWIPFLFFGFAITTNLYREQRRYRFELKPNCLLTRNPVVFVTGPRSIFYFYKYWNAYPEILAEHGYQVFTLHLPWRGTNRLKKLTEFLTSQHQASKKFHFICDEYSAKELKNVFEQSAVQASMTILRNVPPTTSTPQTSSYFLAWAYKLHTWSCFSMKVPSAEDLGLQFPTSSSWLLQTMQEKGEQDFLT